MKLGKRITFAHWFPHTAEPLTLREISIGIEELIAEMEIEYGDVHVLGQDDPYANITCRLVETSSDNLQEQMSQYGEDVTHTAVFEIRVALDN